MGAALETLKPCEIRPSLFSTFVEWIDRGEATARTYCNHLKQFLAWTRYKSIVEPIREDIIAFRDWLISEHEGIMLDMEAPAGWKHRRDKAGKIIIISCTPNTAAQYLRSVQRFFRWTGTSGLYPDISANIRPPKVAQNVHRRDALTAGEVMQVEESIRDTSREALLSAGESSKDTAGRIQRAGEQGARLLALYQLAFSAGLRTVELSRARVKDFEQKDGQYFLWIHGKGHSEADTRKPIAPEVAETIKAYLKTRGGQLAGTSPLFASTGNRSGGKRIAPRTIGSMIKKALRAAGLDSSRLTAHSLRHTAGTLLHELTGNLFTVQRYMRHSNPATTEIYLHTKTEKEEADLAARLFAMCHGGGTDERARLEGIINGLPPAKINQLADIAAAMV